MSNSLFEQVGIKIPTHLQQSKIKDIFQECELDWEVKQKPLFIQNDNDYEELTNTVVNYRSDNDKILGMVHPKNYKIVQNIQAFDFIDELPNFAIDRVGTFNNGKKVFVIGKSTEQIDINNSGDMIDFYLTFLHGHDGKSGIRVIVCPIRFYCTNQLNLMLKTSTFKYNITHTGDIQTKLNSIQRIIGNSSYYIDDLEEKLNTLIDTKPAITIEQFVNRLLPIETDLESAIIKIEDNRQQIINIYNNKDDLQNYKDTAFGMINAVSDFISHKQPGRKTNSSLDNAFIKNIEGNELLETSLKILDV